MKCLEPTKISHAWFKDKQKKIIWTNKSMFEITRNLQKVGVGHSGVSNEHYKDCGLCQHSQEEESP